MSSAINPFHTLYLTEGVGKIDIPSVFSPVLVPHVAPLFLPGNVVLMGMQGTGKTMLLSLLDTKVRLEFWANNDPQNGDPLVPAQRRFVGAGINLSKSNAFKLNEIVVSKDRDENIRLSRAYFSDFVNCWVLRDLFASVGTFIAELTRRGNHERLDEIGITRDVARLDAAVRALANDPRCSFLVRHKTVDEMRTTLEVRLRAYTQLVSNPRKGLSAEIDQTRSLLGEPLTAATQALRTAGVLAGDTSVFVTIDQFETLIRHAYGEGDTEKHWRFVREIDDLISNRVREVSYRIGTRPNAQLSKSETPPSSEATRDYVEVDLDYLLQLKEHDRRKHSLFRQFAEDAFRRRIAVSTIPHREEVVASSAPIRTVFGKSPTVADRGRLCAPKKPEKALKADPSWTKDVIEFLTQLSRSDVIAAKLGEAWVRQLDARGEPLDVADWGPPNALPWEIPAKRWWKKERLPLASLQIAAANQQRLLYFGETDIVQLAGENILVFICICREIWECDARHRAMKTTPQVSPGFEPFNRGRQAEGIRDASRIWHDKMAQSPNGNTLQRLLDVIGKKLHEQLIKDRRMSYPGANGISFSRQDLITDTDVKRLLDDATAECYLLQRDHTPKTPSRGKSIKWYPHPILAPYYELTVQHTKEPLYLTVVKFRSWLEEGKVLAVKPKPEQQKSSAKPKRGSSQKTMFDGDE